jgi:hypothetical protein
MKKIFILIICGLSMTACNPFLGINSWFNKIDYELEKQNDRQKYDRLKKVEDTARAMVSSYESDKQIYLSMKDDNKEIALQAKIRANNTAIQYNQFILKNSYLWKNNIPQDIKNELEIIN